MFIEAAVPIRSTLEYLGMITRKVLFLAAAAAITSLSFTEAAHAGPSLDKIMESKVIRVGTPGDYSPFTTKTATGFSGHDIDVIELVAKELGVKVKLHGNLLPSKDLVEIKA